MAEAVLIGIARSVLRQLGSPAMDEVKLLWNHSTDLENLINTVTTISMVLEDAERRKSSSKAVQVWLEQLNAVLYDADDFFDTISAKAVQNKAKYGSKLYHFLYKVKSAHKVKAIKKRIDAIAKDITDFKFLTTVIEQDRPRREPTHSFVPIDEVVGREKEREDIVKMLLVPSAEQEGVSVIAVIGLGGMGKTTVGQLVYGDSRVQRGFDLHMWACINDFSCLDQVLLTLLESISKRKQEKLATDNLQLMLRQQIEGQRFLLVLDDVWDGNKQNWRKLKILLDCGKQGSVVLATTRSGKVAQSMLAAEPYYHLHGISDESAWILFKKRAFEGKHQHNNSRLEYLGQQIVKKCGNLPLLIVVIASFLRDQEERKWVSLVDEDFPTVIGEDYTNVIQALKISYREFPYPEKRCFAYCSLFPKDYMFDRERLIHLWIAEGFFEGSADDQRLEDRAEECFSFLVEMCFLKMEPYYPDYFKMHDLLHDLAKEVAGSTTATNQTEILDKSLRHFCLTDHDLSSFQLPKCKVRTFIWLVEFGYGGAFTFPKKVMSVFKALRVLVLANLGMKEVPDSIGKLIHLRFLNLSYNDMERLPKSIGNLHNLQYLILRDCRFLVELPVEIQGLISMRVIHYARSPSRSAMLELVHKHGGELRYLERLNQLRGVLRIEIETGGEDLIIDALRADLSKKSRLEDICLKFVKMERGGQTDALMAALEPHPNLERLEIQNFGGSKLPEWASNLDRLVSIKLGDCEVVELPPLSCIQSLKELGLYKMSLLLSVEGNRSYDSGFPFFPSLETLELIDLPNLRGWWMQEPTMLPTFPRVTKLSITGCVELEIRCMPLFEPTLEVLKLLRVQEEVTRGIVKQCSSALRELNISNVTRDIFEGFKLLTSLETLEITDLVNDGVEEGVVTPWEFLQRLHTLVLSFGGFCYSAKGILDGIEHLTNSLTDLTLSNCRVLHLPWTSLLSLRLLDRLKIENVERVIHAGPTTEISSSLKTVNIEGGSAEEWLLDMPWMSFSSLEELWLQSISNLEALPQGIQHLSSLQKLYLLDLQRVTSLPCWISSLPSLYFLGFFQSSEELKKRCQRPTGEDWPLIQHCRRVIIS